MTTPETGLVCNTHILVGSFFNKHAIIRQIDGLWLFVGVMVSGSISPGSTPYFSPFPHGTGALSVSLTYLALAD